jgi:hypothetical protein
MLFDDLYDITEADEAATSKEVALRNATEIFRQYKRGDNTYAIYNMYEIAALNAGCTLDEIEAHIQAATVQFRETRRSN